ncbi:FAD-binding oxidoreductase [Nocardioides insulae]|uniref:FAD-binding oxidoreductase n=1 Tax=Nocardioides insulae TaxID=394734 RepID=UPI00040FE301|nr:FAD-binding oxidoreductase [Nocardioides insulae]
MNELGIAIDLGSIPLERAVSLASRAEAAGLGLVVLEVGDRSQVSPDPWTVAVWVAARTERIALGVARASEEEAATLPAPSAMAKAEESFGLLNGTRLLGDAGGTPAWISADRDADATELERLARGAAPVVVPVQDVADVDRVAVVAAQLTPSEPAGRPAAVRSRRRPGIDYDGVPDSLRETAVEPGDPGYRAVRSTYLRGGAPGLVLRPRTVAEVADSIAFARRHPDLPLGLRSGGHGISGRSTNDGGLVIDVGAMTSIEVLDVERRLVRIGPGATWTRVAAALGPYGWALGSGDAGGVGVGGLATAGGIGYLSREQGLTIDRLRAVDLVLADGTRVRASREENADLFWAVRGAGANFGAATAFEFEAAEVGRIGWAQLAVVTADLADGLRRFGEAASAAPRDTTVFLVTGQPRPGQAVLQMYGIVDSDDPDVIVERLTPFAEIGMLAQQNVVLTTYPAVLGQFPEVGAEGHHGVGEPVSRSGFLPAMTPGFARDVAGLLHSGEVFYFQLRPMGGAIADVPAEETAFAYRTPAFQVTAMGADQHLTDAAWDELADHFEGTYLSFETDRRAARLHDAFPPTVLDRLRRLKRRFDPDNLFRDNFNIDPFPDRAQDALVGAQRGDSDD